MLFYIWGLMIWGKFYPKIVTSGVQIVVQDQPHKLCPF